MRVPTCRRPRLTTVASAAAAFIALAAGTSDARAQARPDDTAAVVGAVAAWLSRPPAQERRPPFRFSAAVDSERTPAALQRAFVERIKLPPQPEGPDVQSIRLRYVIEDPVFRGDSAVLEMESRAVGPLVRDRRDLEHLAITRSRFVLRRGSGGWLVTGYEALRFSNGFAALPTSAPNRDDTLGVIHALADAYSQLYAGNARARAAHPNTRGMYNVVVVEPVRTPPEIRRIFLERFRLPPEDTAQAYRVQEYRVVYVLSHPTFRGDTATVDVISEPSTRRPGRTRGLGFPRGIDRWVLARRAAGWRVVRWEDLGSG